MGYREDGYTTGASFYATDPANQMWIEGDVIERAVLRPLADAGVLERCRFVSYDFEDPVELPSIDELYRRSRTWSSARVQLTSDGSDDADVDILVRCDRSEAKVGFRVGGDVLRELRPRLLAIARAWVLAQVAAMPETIRFSGAGLSPWMKDYPRPIPPRHSRIWTFGLVADYIGLSFHADPDYADELERLKTAPLPPGARREILGDVLALTFLDDLADDAAVANARAAHERWMSGLVGTTPERGWNELGDRIVIPASPEPLDPLTIYDPDDGTGYRAMVVELDGSVDQELWAEMVTLLRSGQAPDGRPLHRLRLIVPRREDVLTLRDRALAAGFDTVVYPGHPGVFWEVLGTNADRDGNAGM